MKLIGYKKIDGLIRIITGLHIGGSVNTIEIGGKDNPVIKHPLTKEPYIPGSSLKGKMRSLLEWKLGMIDTKPGSRNYGEVHSWCGDKTCPICVIFGTSADEADIGPTRLIVRDAVLDNNFKENKMKESDNMWSPISLTEEKYENSINRITARANPRNFERVISGTVFSFSMSYRVFECVENERGQNDANLFNHVLEGLRLLEKDALGGAGSRGCGQVKFLINIEGEYKDLDQLTDRDFPNITE